MRQNSSIPRLQISASFNFLSLIWVGRPVAFITSGAMNAGVPLNTFAVYEQTAANDLGRFPQLSPKSVSLATHGLLIHSPFQPLLHRHKFQQVLIAHEYISRFQVSVC